MADVKFAPTFQTPWSDHRDRIGQSFELVRIVDQPDDSHDAEVLPMYVIRFPDGVEIEAWPEEVAAGWPGWEHHSEHPIGERP